MKAAAIAHLTCFVVGHRGHESEVRLRLRPQLCPSKLGSQSMVLSIEMAEEWIN